MPDVLIGDLDCGAFATSGYEEEEDHRERERHDLHNFGPRETSSGKNPTCCLWLGLIPLLTWRRRHVAGFLVVVSNRLRSR